MIEGTSPVLGTVATGPYWRKKKNNNNNRKKKKALTACEYARVDLGKY